MKMRFTKLNSKGFSHHLILPIVAIVAIAGIGAYVVTKSKAYIAPEGDGTSHVASCSITAPSQVATGTSYNPKLVVKNVSGSAFTPKVLIGASGNNSGGSTTVTLTKIAAGQSASYYYGARKSTAKGLFTYTAKSSNAGISYSCSKKVTIY